MNLGSKKFAYVSMGLLVVAWGFEYIAAKSALTVVSPLPLVCIKYLLGCAVLLSIKLARDRRFPFSKRHLPLLIICSVTGELLYYACEYGAMAYLPVSVISIVLAFVPAVSIVLEKVLYHRRTGALLWLGIAASIVGVALVIGGGLSDFRGGAGIGYVLIFGAVFCWNAYNFLTQRLAKAYRPFDLTLYQTICTALIALPFLLHDLPAAAALAQPPVLWGLVYVGVVCESIGFLIYVNAVGKLGPTPCAMFSTMLPVSTTFFGWLCLGERVLPLQLLGGAVVIVSGILVLREKARLDGVQ
ncbi:MAG: DMT family transporter [Clostridiales Family XIII bacterium]|jgi:drug/metabolite transporter (DMT)-like permease|nr:DMT family transporter [Clostridiales Family XIII bacterium]